MTHAPSSRSQAPREPDQTPLGAPPAVRLRIDQLVVHGLPVGAGEGARLVTAVENELTRLIGRGGLPGASRVGVVPSVPAPLLQIGTSVRPAALGCSIARTIYSALTQGR